jgi:hypothetical protein
MAFNTVLSVEHTSLSEIRSSSDQSYVKAINLWYIAYKFGIN